MVTVVLEGGVEYRLAESSAAHVELNGVQSIGGPGWLRVESLLGREVYVRASDVRVVVFERNAFEAPSAPKFPRETPGVFDDQGVHLAAALEWERRNFPKKISGEE